MSLPAAPKRRRPARTSRIRPSRRSAHEHGGGGRVRRRPRDNVRVMATDRFQEIERRYEELNRELSSPEVASDPSRLRDLGKQHAELEDVVRTHRALDEAERLAREWREMAREERDASLTAELKSEAEAADRRAAELRER